MNSKENISRHLAGFRPIGTAFTLFSLLNLAVFALIYIWPGLLEGLWLSADRPWGILISAFTHADLGHLAGNLEGFVLAAGLFVGVTAIHRPPIRRRMSRAFLWLVFISGFAANALEYPLHLAYGPGFHSWGASGVVYGALGVLLAVSLRSLPAHFRAIAREHRRWAGRRRCRALFKFDRRSLRTFPDLLCLAVVTTFLLMIFTDTGGFLSAGPGVDVIAHGLGFLFGFLGSMVLFQARPFGKHRP